MLDESMRDTDPEVRRQADLWFARRLDPAVREAEHAAFEHWHNADRLHAEAYAETERLWNRLEILKKSTRLNVSTSALQSVVPSRWVAHRRHFLHAIAAGLALFAIASAIYFFNNRTSPERSFVTALGEQRTETLRDGTILRLNTSSAVDVRMTSSRRELTLEHGEAAFDVAKDVSRPFVVSAGDGMVTAVGTHFQVRHEGDQVIVTLMEGRVQLVRPSRHELEWLEPGQQALFSESASGIVKRNVDARALTSWMNGRLEFRDTPLVEAVAEANRYSARKLRIADPRINRIPVAGTFRTGDVESVAAAFAAAFPVRAELAADEIVLYGR